jgi:hypothetical protein
MSRRRRADTGGAVGRAMAAHFKLEIELALNCYFEAGEQLEFRYTEPAAVVVTLKERGRLGEDRPGRHGNTNSEGLATEEQLEGIPGPVPARSRLTDRTVNYA